MVGVVPKERIYRCEHDPALYGNGSNDVGNPRWTYKNWVKSLFHFNFLEYTTGKPNFGVLRLLNDDLIQPKRGFGAHPHDNQEIVAYVVKGELTHTDSMGSTEVLGRGSAYCMTAGSGVEHSESNQSDTEPMRFITVWVKPRESGVRPKFELYTSKGPEERAGKWFHIASPMESPESSKFKWNQDANVFVTELSEAGNKIELPLAGGRQAYILAVEGSFVVEDGELSTAQLNQDEAAEVVSSGADGTLSFTAHGGPAHILVVEMQS